MSGSGEYGPGPGGPSSPCSSLTFEAPLQSPKPSVVKKLKVQDRLEVISRGKDGPIIARHPTHGIAGSIVERMANLLKCIEEGTEYIAEVISIDGGIVRVKVTAK